MLTEAMKTSGANTMFYMHHPEGTKIDIKMEAHAGFAGGVDDNGTNSMINYAGDQVWYINPKGSGFVTIHVSGAYLQDLVAKGITTLNIVFSNGNGEGFGYARQVKPDWVQDSGASSPSLWVPLTDASLYSNGFTVRFYQNDTKVSCETVKITVTEY